MGFNCFWVKKINIISCYLINDYFYQNRHKKTWTTYFVYVPEVSANTQLLKRVKAHAILREHPYFYLAVL